MEKYSKVLLSVGGNQDDTSALFERMWPMIETSVGKLEAVSPFYRSKAWGFESAHEFINAAAVVLSSLSPMEVLDATQDIERRLGRTRKSTDGCYHDRPIDIDLIAYDTLVLQNERLTLPHPLMDRRRFVLQPLCDICPDWEHPLLHKKVRTLLEECTDGIAVSEQPGVNPFRTASPGR